MSAEGRDCPQCGVEFPVSPFTDEPLGCPICESGDTVSSQMRVYAGGIATYVYDFAEARSRAPAAGLLGSATEVERETVFTIRMRHPSPDDPVWRAYVEGPNSTFDVGIGSEPDEALEQVVDTIAFHRYSQDDDDHPDDLIGG